MDASSEPPNQLTRSSTGLRSALLLCYHYAPSREVGARRIVALSRYLAANGVDVTVVHGYSGEAPAEPPRERISIQPVRAPTPVATNLAVSVKRAVRRFLGLKRVERKIQGSGDEIHVATDATSLASAMRRAFFRVVHVVDTYKKWAWRAARVATALVRRNDIDAIWASGPPMTGLLGAALAARWTKCPLIVDFRDPLWHPLDFNPEGLNARIAPTLERFLIERANAVTCTSPCFATILRERYPAMASQIHTVLNGFDGVVSDTPATSTGGVLRFAFAGALYYNRDPFPFFAALEELLGTEGVDATKVSVVFVGECDNYRGTNLKRALAGTKCTEILEIRRPVASDEVRRIYAESTVLLNFAQGQPLQIPAKTFELLVTGRELLFFCEPDSDTARVTREICGIKIASDSTELPAILSDLYERHVRRGVLEAPDQAQLKRFSREAQNAALLEILRSVTESASR